MQQFNITLLKLYKSWGPLNRVPTRENNSPDCFRSPPDFRLDKGSAPCGARPEASRLWTRRQPFEKGWIENFRIKMLKLHTFAGFYNLVVGGKT